MGAASTPTAPSSGPSDSTPYTCMECGEDVTPSGCFARKINTCGKCGNYLCADCFGKHPLIPFDPANPEESNDLSKNKELKSYSISCFKEVSTIDYSTTWSVVEPLTTNKNNGITLLYVHGGGGSREMFRGHAQRLAEEGFRGILIDLPGHGTLVDTTLTLKNCTATVQSILTENNLVPGGNVIYVGGSLGAYIGFHILSKLKDHFKGAVLMDCGQNVGPGCSTQASLGLWMLKTMTGMMSNRSLVEMMAGLSEKSPADYKLVETVYGSGMFFEQGEAQVECLKAVAPAELIPTYGPYFPILFMNGSEDHRDSEDKWLSLCEDKRSALKVYEGGDHFFSHDSRFLDDIVTSMSDFAKKAAA